MGTLRAFFTHPGDGNLVGDHAGVFWRWIAAPLEGGVRDVTYVRSENGVSTLLLREVVM